jgi:hypothetical protein
MESVRMAYSVPAVVKTDGFRNAQAGAQVQLKLKIAKLFAQAWIAEQEAGETTPQAEAFLNDAVAAEAAS